MALPLELPSKEDRLLFKRTAMNHAMLFTGVDEEKGKPKKWRVENSWGEKGDGKGFYVMNDSWFDEHMFEIAARRSRLPPRCAPRWSRSRSSFRPGTPWARWPNDAGRVKRDR